MLIQSIFIQPDYSCYDKEKDSVLFNYRFAEIAIMLLNQYKIISRDFEDYNHPNAKLLEAKIRGDGPFIIRPIKEEISDYGVKIRALSSDVEVEIGGINLERVDFSVQYNKELFCASQAFEDMVPANAKLKYRLYFKPE